MCLSGATCLSVTVVSVSQIWKVTPLQPDNIYQGSCVVFDRSGKLHIYNRTTYTGVAVQVWQIWKGTPLQPDNIYRGSCVVFGRSGKLHFYNRTTYTGVVEVAAKSTYSIILHFMFLFSLFVFFSAAGHYFLIWTGHYFSIWTGQVPALLFQIKSITQQIVHVTSGLTL